MPTSVAPVHICRALCCLWCTRKLNLIDFESNVWHKWCAIAHLCRQSLQLQVLVPINHIFLELFRKECLNVILILRWSVKPLILFYGFVQ